MENPNTWNYAIKEIQEALTECQRQREEQIIGYSDAKIIYNHLRKKGLLLDSPEQLDNFKKEIRQVVEILSNKFEFEDENGNFINNQNES